MLTGFGDQVMDNLVRYIHSNIFLTKNDLCVPVLAPWRLMYLWRPLQGTTFLDPSLTQHTWHFYCLAMETQLGLQDCSLWERGV